MKTNLILNKGALRQLNCRNALLLLIGCFISSCNTVSIGKMDTSDAIIGRTDDSDTSVGKILFKNNTSLVIKIVRGTATIYECTIFPEETAEVSYNLENGAIYYPRFYIPLTADYLYPRLEEAGLRPSDSEMYYRVDGSKKEQTIIIHPPDSLNDSAFFLAIMNNNKTGGINLINSVGVLPCFYPTANKTTIGGGETAFYKPSLRDTLELQVSPGNQKLENITYRPSFVYYFTYDGSMITLTDARPLTRIGEPSWHKTIPDAASPFYIIAENNGNMSLVSSAGNRVVFYPIDSSGQLAEKKNIPVNENKHINIKTVSHLSANTWLAAGGVDPYNGAFFDPVNLAWIGEIRDTGVLLWELGPAAFIAQGFPRCGTVQSVAWNEQGGFFRICGELIAEYDSFGNPLKDAFPGSYLCTVHIEDGKGVLLENPSFYRDVFFNQIQCAKDGVFYVAGKTISNGQTRPIVRKYNSALKQEWQASPQSPASTFYSCAVLDEENDQIVLAGTLQAAGKRPAAFMRGINIKDGKETWFWSLEPEVFSKTPLVTGIVKAPEYGFIITLAGMAGDKAVAPFMAVRVNERGRYIK
jgi:hypothetical protein